MASTTVNFNLKTAGFVNYANQTLTFRLLTAGAEAATGDQSYVTLPGVVTATSAANGDGSVSLFRNGKSGIESVYEVILPNREKAKFIIPSGSATIELATLLVDHVPGGSDTQQSSVYAEAIKRANHTGTQALSTISDAATVQLKPSEGAFANGDKAKLNGIEAGATANQTNAEIRAAVEAATDSNVFTDSDHTKLNGIETSATADQTASEIRALVESATDSNVFTDADHTKLENIAGTTVEEVQDIAGGLITAAGGTKTGIAITYDDANNNMDFVVASQTDQNFTTADHSKLDGIEVSATADQTASEIRTLVESATDSNVFTDADHTKLNAIEPLADVTDTANVTSAGALMDSEVDADIKTLSLPASTTISALGKTIVGGANAAAVRSTLEIADSAAVSNFVPNSISFNAATDNLSIANNAAMNVGTGDFSLSFFARVNNNDERHILSKLSGTGYSIKFNNGSLILTMQDSGGSANFTLATGLNDNKWHVYVVTVDRNDTAIAYVDNVAQTGVSVSGTAGTLDNSGSFLIGNNNSVASSNLFALGYYIILHKSELSASNASQIYFSPDQGLTAVVPTLMVDLRRADRTFKDISSSGLTVTTNNTITFNQERITSLDGATIGATTPAAVTGTNVLANNTLGYSSGSGGTITQATGKGTAVTLNKINGEIVMNSAALADDATATFTLNNNLINATNVVIVNVASVGTPGAYQVTVGAVATGSCSMSVLNVSGGSLSQAIKLNFAVIAAVKT